jgi:hypothetical protein
MSRRPTARARAKRSKKARAARTRSTATPLLNSKLARALAALARDLPNPADESTDFFRPFVAPMPPDSRLDAGTFQRALKIGVRYTIALSPADALLARAGDPDNSGKEIAEGFRLLEKVMRATLSELSVAFARGEGIVRVRMWLFGRSEDGALVGLRSISTET